MVYVQYWFVNVYLVYLKQRLIGFSNNSGFPILYLSHFFFLPNVMDTMKTFGYYMYMKISQIIEKFQFKR